MSSDIWPVFSFLFLSLFFIKYNCICSANSLIAAKEKLEIVIGAAPPRLRAGLSRRRRRRNAFELS
jgi:hypothetical protein